MTLDMIAKCVDESGRPAVLIRADRRATIIKIEMRPGDAEPTRTESYNDDYNKTVIISKGVGLAFAGEPSMGLLAADVIKRFADRLENEGVAQEVASALAEALALEAEKMGASKLGRSHMADLLIGIRTVDGSVAMLRAVVATAGLSMTGDGFKRAPEVSMQMATLPLAVGLDFIEPNVVLHKTLHDWFGDPQVGGDTAGHSVAVVGAFMENAFAYELEHNPNSKGINDRATYLLVSKDGTRQLSDDEVGKFRELNERISKSKLAPRHAVAEMELSRMARKNADRATDAVATQGKTTQRLAVANAPN